ncbi:MAG: UDP-N-acetylmuramate--L-alanine ligase [Planctomycetota bacterium]|nr:UDP-N-acetylmuramate--L-alanine ligase [Planctomycetota bacterium]
MTSEPLTSSPDTPTLPGFTGQRIHLVGAGGSGMSGLAMMLHGHGFEVSGSDSQNGPELAPLRAAGISLASGESAFPLPSDCELLIHSAAISPGHPELSEARKRALPILSYAEALGLLQAMRSGISIAGTHGKSTTSALLAHILLQAGLDPNVIVGAHCRQIGGGWHLGASRIPGSGPMAGRPGLMICEACEFNRSFHHHHPLLALINNIEEDHLDIYAGIEEIIEAFRVFARRIPRAEDGGYLLIGHEGAHRIQVAAGLECAVETFGFSPEADWQFVMEAGTIRLHDRNHEAVAQWRMPMPGSHNAANSVAAAVLANRVGVGWGVIEQAIGGFGGLDRRTQRLGARRLNAGGTVEVVDDYGHHPSEVELTLKALQTHYEPKRIICIFQPHQHSRTRFLLEQFATSFERADLVIVPEIYFVRDSEAERQKVSAGDLVERLRDRGTRALHLHPFEAIVEQLEVICRDGDLVVSMGAGPVWEISHAFLEAGDE